MKSENNSDKVLSRVLRPDCHDENEYVVQADWDDGSSECHVFPSHFILADVWRSIHRKDGTPSVSLSVGPPDDDVLLQSIYHCGPQRPPTADEVHSQAVELLDGVDDVVDVDVDEDDTSRYFVTVTIDEKDLDVWEDVFDREARLYDAFPDACFEFSIIERDEGTEMTSWELAEWLNDGKSVDGRTTKRVGRSMFKKTYDDPQKSDS